MLDGFGWADICATPDELLAKSAEQQSMRRTVENATFNRVHQLVEECVVFHHGSVWNTIGDCIIAGGFPDVSEAVTAAEEIQRRLSYFNRNENELGQPLLVRIGVTCGNLPDVPMHERGAVKVHDLDEAGHLEKDCPPGKIRISRRAYDALTFGPDHFRPGLQRSDKSLSADSFVWIEQSLTFQEGDPRDTLAPSQRRACPVIAVGSSYYASHPYQKSFKELSKELEECLIILGETRPEKPGSIVSHPAPTSDAVGVLEITAAMQASPRIVAGLDEWVDTGDLAPVSNLVVIGSPVVNIYAHAINAVVPVQFVVHDGGFLRIRVREKRGYKLFPSTVEHSHANPHFGLVLLTASPLNPKRSLLWIAGITGMATQAAARLVRDLILNCTQTLADRFPPHSASTNMAVVAPDWGAGREAEHYLFGGWRVSEYKVVWAGKQGDT